MKAFSAAALVLFLMTAAVPATGGKRGDMSKLTCKSLDTVANADEVGIVVEKDQAVVRVRHKRGIGKAEVALVEGPWPKGLRLELDGFGMLEHLALHYGDEALTTSLGAAPAVKVGKRLKDGTYEEGRKDDRYRMPMAQKGKQIVVTLPANLFRAEEKTLKIHWIDAYR
jgi:hypothetical protein